MNRSVIIITGCDAFFYPFMDEALRSLIALNLHDKAKIGILDLGLDPEQIRALEALGCIIQKPVWTLNVPEEIRKPQQLGLVARTELREYFPGFNVYLWFDADAWAQTTEFFETLVEGARATGAAIVRENGSGYSRDMVYNRWWYGHLIASYGIVRGIRVAFKPAINIGIMAIAETAPHWQAWKNHYQLMIDKRDKLNMDQHAFNAALEIERLPGFEAPARCNWICTLSPPVWDKERKLLCEPNEKALPLSVLHLAGPDKRRIYTLKDTAGGMVATSLGYDKLKSL